MINAALAVNGSKYNRDQQTYLYEIKDSEVTFDFTPGVIPIVNSSVDVLDPNNYNNATINVDSSGNYTTDGSGTEISAISLIRNRTDDDTEDNFSAHIDAIYGTTDNNFPTPEQGTKLLSDLVPGFAQILGGPEGSVTDHVIADFPALDAFFTGGNKAVLDTVTTRPDRNPTVEESSLGFYADANATAEIAGRTLRANAGIRAVNTSQTSQNKTREGADILIERDYWNLLPSFNLAYDARDDVVIRMSGGQALTRPSMGELQASTSFSSDFTANADNPYLNPYLSDQIDLTAEWYYKEDSMVALNFFHKQLTGFVENRTETAVFSDTGININDLDPNIFVDLTPDTLITLARTVNSDELREIKGMEFVLQHPLDNILEGLGFYGNYSYIHSSDVTLSSGSTEVVTTIAGLSPHLLNLVLYYESDLFSIRGSYNWRDSFPTSTGLQGTQTDIRTREAVGQYDLSVQIPLPRFDDLQLTLEGINLNNVKEYEYFGVPERNFRFAGTGRQYFIGLRGTF